MNAESVPGGRCREMLVRTYPFIHFLIAASVCGCASDRVPPDRASSGGVGGAPGDDAGSVCAYGQIICDGNVAKVCDGQGQFAHVILCKDECKDGQGCVSCVPNTGACDPASKLATLCDSTGSYTITFSCDGDCQPDGCRSPCSPMTLGTSNVGCEFWSTVTANSVWSDRLNTWDSGLHFGVLLGNTSATDVAAVSIKGPKTTTTLSLQPKAVQAVMLKWVPALKGGDWQTPWQPVSSSASANSDPFVDPDNNGAYHIQSSQPLVAYQFSPVEGTAALVDGCPSVPGSPTGCFSYSTDASLLLPWHSLFGASYVATGYHALHQQPFPASMPSSELDMGDFLSITATQDETWVKVTLPPNQTVLPWANDPQITPGVPFKMEKAGQVIQLVTPGKSADETLSGTEILSGAKPDSLSGTKPIQVLSGMGCASIPLDPNHCGHMEDSVAPKEAFGKDYVVALLHGPPDDAKPLASSPVPHTIRVQAISDGTAITFEPSLMMGVTLGKGEVLEIPNVTADVRISSTVPFGVTQFVNGRAGSSSVGFSVGGPNQVTAVPIAQFQTSYAFAASPKFDYNYVGILAPTGASVTIDDVPIMSSQFKAVGSSGMSVAHVDLKQNDRLHDVSADKPVGIVVYGYTRFASYAYPGGLDLKHGPPTH